MEMEIQGTILDLQRVTAEVVAAIKGEDGAPGQDGSQGQDGEPGLNWQGTYNPALSYLKNDGVYYLGSCYIALKNMDAGTFPTDVDFWDVLAQGVDNNLIITQISAWEARKTDGATWVTEETSTNKLTKSGFKFSGSLREYIQIELMNLNGTMLTSAGLKVKIQSKIKDSTIPDGNTGVVWGIRAAIVTTTIDVALETAVSLTQTISSAGTRYTSEWSGIVTASGSISANCCLLIEIYRDVENGSDNTSNPIVITNVQIEINQ